MEAVAAQAALPECVRQWQLLFDLGQGVVEAGIEAGHLGDVRALAQEDLDRLQREGLVQRCQRDVALEVGQHTGIHPHRCEVLAAAVDHAMGDGGDRAAVEAGDDAFADQLQGGAIRGCGVQLDRERHHSGLAEVRLRSTDALHLAVPLRLARRRIGIGVVHGELDARRAAVEDQDQALRIHGGVLR